VSSLTAGRLNDGYNAQTLRFPNRAAVCTGLKQALQQVKPTQVDAGLACGLALILLAAQGMRQAWRVLR